MSSEINEDIKDVKDVFVLGDPTFRVNMQKWPKTLFFWKSFALMKGIYDIVLANNRYLHKVDTLSVYMIVIRHFSRFRIVHMGYIQQIGEVTYAHLILVLWLFSIILHSNYS